jgi:CubicO group peptidase (beta-lactamase class C family)
MKHRLLLLCALCLSAAGLPAGPIAGIIEPYVARKATPGNVFLIADNTGILDCEAAGFADIAAQKPMRADALFWIASVSKPLAAACVMMLVDEGKISLDDPVSKYIPAFAGPLKIAPPKDKKGDSDAPPAASAATATTAAAAPAATASAATTASAAATRPITIRHLLSHTSGIPSSTAGADTRPLAESAPAAAAGRLRFEPGAGYTYSNPGISVLGRVVEIAGGMPFETFLQKRLLDPLGMTGTTFWPDKAQLARLVTCYRGDPEKNTLTPVPVPFLSQPLDDRAVRHPWPAGGLFSTAADLARFGQLFLNKGMCNGRRILSETAIAEMTRRQTPPSVRNDYGLGFVRWPGGRFGHNGTGGTNLTIWPGQNRVTVFMAQATKWGAPDGGKLRPALEALASPGK